MRIGVNLPGPFRASGRVRRTGITLRNIRAVREENRQRRARIKRNLSNRAYAKELRRNKILY